MFSNSACLFTLHPCLTGGTDLQLKISLFDFGQKELRTEETIQGKYQLRPSRITEMVIYTHHHPTPTVCVQNQAVSWIPNANFKSKICPNFTISNSLAILNEFCLLHNDKSISLPITIDY